MTRPATGRAPRLPRLSAAFLALALGLFVAGAAWATDYTKLREDPRVDRELFATSVAWTIAEKCDRIAPRRFWALLQALDLAAYARGLGYTNAELDAYVNDKTEQARFLARAKAWLAQHGAREDDPESYCRIGEDQIAKGTLVGKLLKVTAPAAAASAQNGKG